MTEKATIFVIDDDKLSRESVCALIESMGLTAERFASAEDFLAGYDARRSGCVITDIRMLGMSGIELQDELERRGIRIPVVVISAFATTAVTVAAIKKGAVTLLEKPCDDQELWDAIRTALRQDAGQRHVMQRQANLRDRFARLSDGEHEVLSMISDGMSNKAIAYRLDISTRTVETRRSNLFRKLEVNSIAELIRLAIEAGVIRTRAQEHDGPQHP